MACANRIKDMYLCVDTRGRHGPTQCQVELTMYSHREAWMPEDYDAVSLNLRLGDFSGALTHLSACTVAEAMEQMADCWQSLAEALRYQAGQERAIAEATGGCSTDTLNFGYVAELEGTVDEHSGC